VGNHWFVDETYMKVVGQWRYVYQAIDKVGQDIDVLISARRNASAARRFFDQAVGAIKVTPAEVVAGHCFVQKLRRGHEELAVEKPSNRRLAVAFDELVLAI
jgi:transposase-like protein